MANISVKTQGAKGGNPTWKNSVGYTAVFYNGENNHILSDAFEGSGESYRERKVELIEVAHNGEVLFSGSFNELCDILKTK